MSEIENHSQEAPQVDATIIKEAEAQGWVPREKFRGSDDEWVDAETFVKRGREIMPILRKNNETLLKELTATKEQLKEFKRTAEEFKQFQKEAHQKRVTEMEQQITALKQAKAQAISDGDGERANQLDDALDELKEAKQAAKEKFKDDQAETKEVIQEQSTVALDHNLQQWLGRNEWFGKDRKLTEWTNAAGEELRAQYPDLVGEAFLEKLDEVLQEEFPHKFGKKERPNPVESGAGRSGGRVSSNKQSYASLPDDAKAACDRYVKQGLIKSREEYVAMYYGND